MSKWSQLSTWSWIFSQWNTQKFPLSFASNAAASCVLLLLDSDAHSEWFWGSVTFMLIHTYIWVSIRYFLYFSGKDILLLTMGKGHCANNNSYFNFTLLSPFKMKLFCFRSVWVGHPLRAACVREAWLTLACVWQGVKHMVTLSIRGHKYMNVPVWLCAPPRE